ncbi:hypothetical protein [Streptomyces sp. NPDC059063]|uniref:hypothetical protein n=1 Tax=unclassified Streptomyces TaxID=2593676 RepID=UPI0036B53AC0
MTTHLTWEIQRLSGTAWMTTEGETITASDYDYPEVVARCALAEHLRGLPDEDNDQRRALVWRGRHPFGDSWMATERDLLGAPSRPPRRFSHRF